MLYIWVCNHIYNIDDYVMLYREQWWVCNVIYMSMQSYIENSDEYVIIYISQWWVCNHIHIEQWLNVGSQIVGATAVEW